MYTNNLNLYQKHRQNKTNKNNEGKTDCPLSHDSSTKVPNIDEKQATNDPNLNNITIKNKQLKSKVPKITKLN